MPDIDAADGVTAPPTSRRRFGVKLVLFVVAAVAFALAFIQFREHLTLSALAEREATLVAYGREHPVLVVLLAFLTYTAVTGLSVPGIAAPLTMGIGWYFKQLFGGVNGFLIALATISFASTSGATLSFLFARYLFRDPLRRRFGKQLQKFDAALEREGAFYLFSLRLIPAVPFWLINLLMGLTPLAVGTYWWVSQVGMLPGTAVYVYAGSVFPSAQRLAETGAKGVLKPQIVIAFVLLALFPIVVKKLTARRRVRDEGRGMGDGRWTAERGPGTSDHR